MRLLATADGHEDFWPAYTDILMVTCLVMVLLAATFALLRQDDRVAEELKRRKQSFSERFDAHMAEARRKGHVTLASPAGERQVISFSDTLLFRKGDAALTQPIGVTTLARLAGLLGPMLRAQSHFHTVQVNGHTDPDPIETTQYPSNWHLSSARATSVVYYLTQWCGVMPERLSATGFAHYSPFAPNGAKLVDKARMRRIEVVLLYPQDWIAKSLEAAKSSRLVPVPRAR